MNKWIKCSDRLPENGDRVLTFSQNYLDGDYASCIFCLGKNRDNMDCEIWFDTNDSNKSFNDITHWMPLPDPPSDVDE